MTHMTRIRELLSRRAEGLARIEDADLPDGSLSLLIFPEDAHADPVHVRVVADRAWVRFGAGAKVPLGWGEVGDEEDVLDIVDAIIRGNATEYAWLALDATVHFFSHVVGARISTRDGEDVPLVSVRRLPAWGGDGRAR